MSSFPHPHTYVQPHIHPQTHAYATGHGPQPRPFAYPPAPPGTFRLFRLLSLYPTPKIQLQTFPYWNTVTSASTAASTAAVPNWPPAAPDSFPHHVGVNKHYGYDHGYAYPQGRAYTCPPYDAISYAWNPRPSLNPGHDADTSEDQLPAPDLLPCQPITVVISSEVDNVMAPTITIQITNHLLYGLLTVQELCTPVWLFVDALCIDQHDTRDKAVQVQGMDRVFRGARRVLIWLGSDHVSASEAANTMTSGSALTSAQQGGMDTKSHAIVAMKTDMSMGACLDSIPQLVQQLESYLREREQDQVLDGDDYKALVKPDFSASATSLSVSSRPMPGIPPSTSPLWPALERLRLNSWFQRLWVVQEVTLSRQAIVLYGNRSLPWSMYARFTSLCENVIVSQFSQEHKTELINQLHFAYNSRVSAMTKMHGKIANTLALADSHTINHGDDSRDYPTVLDLLINLVRTSKVAVPLDRVYAVMGLLSDRMRESIRIDYSNSMMDNYCIKWVEFFQSMLMYAPAVAERIFSNAAYLERHPQLPSWCPNLADRGERRGISMTLGTKAGMPSGKEWRAGTDAWTVAIVPGTPHIRLLGFQVDKITHVIDLSWIKDSLQWARVSVDQDSEIESEVAREILVTFWKCLENMTELGTAVSNGDAVLARCLVANAYDEQAVKPAQLLQDYVAFTQYLEHHTWRPLSGGSLKKSTKTAALRFGDRFQRMARKRAIFITSTGQTGLCSHRAKEGDVLCVLMNFQLPYLLRGRDDGDLFELVGETYVDGIMRGEAFKGRNMTKENPTEFVVC